MKRLLIALAISAVWTAGAQAVKTGEPAAEIAGESWINSTPLTMAGLRGRVVLVDFWTFG